MDVRSPVNALCSLIHQDSGLLSGTVRFCLDPTGRFSEDQLWQMLSYVEIGELSRGLDTEVGSIID